MMRPLLPVALVAALAAAPFHAQAEGSFRLKSVSVELPPGDRMFPDGPGADAINSNCLACHSAGMVLNQPPLSKAQWQAEVNKMRTSYKAPIDPDAINDIVGYLTRTKGTK